MQLGSQDRKENPYMSEIMMEMRVIIIIFSPATVLGERAKTQSLSFLKWTLTVRGFISRHRAGDTASRRSIREPYMKL